ncbi:hypothetical protein TNIN_469801 [Trichonephila inaurata madagascariensis]|uniref:Uncharacterized protein n=1 Tax=Trichonephila inaurata madagascariensis TaxID=2747483 RepID=A0A8X6XT49_9ARAC|nr:hypothetical protein TNIN_469801 [Trichonephila inaurata madagascariensis]
METNLPGRMKAMLQRRKTAMLQRCKTAMLQRRKTAMLQRRVSTLKGITQAVSALGDNNNYGRVPKILRFFPDEIVKKRIIHTKRDLLSEGNITKMMKFLFDEVEKALAALKIKGGTVWHRYPQLYFLLRKY